MQVSEEGKEAETYYQVQESFELEGRALSLLDIEIKTGRTHQIRSQLSHLGHSLLGDTKYGN